MPDVYGWIYALAVAHLRIEVLEIDPHIEDKLESKHGVTVEEVEEVCASTYRPLRLREGLYALLGQSEAGRYLVVVLAPKGGGVWKIVTARGMEMDERRRYRRK